MESNFKHRNWWKKEKGLTLVETVIALAIVAIVSTAAISMTIYSTNALTKSREKSFCSGETDNYATLFLSYGEDDYVEAFNALTGGSISGYENAILYYDVDYKFTTSDKAHFYTTFTYSNENNTLDINFYDSGDNVLYTRSISK